MAKSFQKKNIYYSRTYRRIHTNFLYAALYVMILVLPVLIAFITNLKRITLYMCQLAQLVLSEAVQGKTFTIKESGYVPFGITYCLEFDSSYPTSNELLINLLVVIVIISVLVLSSWRGRPITVYLLFSFMLHIISCVYFIFEQNYFVYTATEFSDIIIKQQISIWILFIVVMGGLTAFVGSGGLFDKVAAFLILVVYSAVFGIIRYIVFMFILAEASVLYMADMYFITGPIFDFLYLIEIYAIYTHRMQKRLDSPEGEDQWAWL